MKKKERERKNKSGKEKEEMKVTFWRHLNRSLSNIWSQLFEVAVVVVQVAASLPNQSVLEPWLFPLFLWSNASCYS